MAELVGTTDTTVDSVPIEMLDYAYVGSCTDVKLVQKILAVLKSGKEGLYPDVRVCHSHFLLIFIRLYS